MFGKGGSALSIWIKEFCELVFIQTLQAFIYALVIAFIVEILKTGAGSDMTSDDHNGAVGIICVVALTAIFKVEDLVRNIFGFGKTKADHGNALASLARTKFALDLGKSVLDNGKKVLTGAGAVMGAHGKKVKARKNYLKDLEAYNKDNGLDGSRSTSGSSMLPSGADGVDTSRSDQYKIDAKKRDQRIQLQQDAARARELAMNETDPAKKKALIAEAKSKLEQSKAIDFKIKEPISGSGLGGGTSSSGSSGKSASLPKDYHQKMRQFQANYDKEIKEINKSKREGYKNLAKGILESGGAAVGFTAGAIMGGADGDIKEAIQGGVAGMGIGDRLMSGTVDLTSGVMEFAENRAKAASDMVHEYATNVKEAYKQQISDVDAQIQRGAQSAIDDINNQVSRARTRTSSSARSAAKAAMKGLKTTYQNHSIKHLDKRINSAIDSIEKQARVSKISVDDKDVLH